ncbi:MAG: quinolinate synthase NadA [Deltaproteobacteria bacterium]|nr:quinolinate synthase NadA [Deltaproteobacteria bacterium]
MDLIQKIKEEKKRLNAVLVAHFYQEGAIQDLADFVGDSLAMAQYCETSEAQTLVVCGVRFMAETAKILNPEKKVLLPDLDAGCSLADSCQPKAFEYFKNKLKDPYVVMYINSNPEIKALSDVICTSSNAEKIIASVPPDRTILFGPDRHLGRYLKKKSGRDMVLWQGVCIVHETFNEEKLLKLMLEHPQAQVIAHPECEENILNHAHFVGSTAALLKYSQENKAQEFIVLTESGILHQMQKASPHKTFIQGPDDSGCNCAECPYMRLNTLEKLYECLKNESPEIIMAESLRLEAQKPLRKMLELSR